LIKRSFIADFNFSLVLTPSAKQDRIPGWCEIPGGKARDLSMQGGGGEEGGGGGWIWIIASSLASYKKKQIPAAYPSVNWRKEFDVY